MVYVQNLPEDDPRYGCFRFDDGKVKKNHFYVMVSRKIKN